MLSGTSWLPDTLKVDITDDLTLPLNVKPIIKAIGDTENVKLNRHFPYFVVTDGILIIYFNRYFVANLVHVNLEGLVEDGPPASSIFRGSLEFLPSSKDFAVRVHLAEDLSVTREMSFDYSEG